MNNERKNEVLICEDEFEHYKAIRGIIEEEGYKCAERVESEAGVVSALRAAYKEKRRFAAVLIDVSLRYGNERKTGIEVYDSIYPEFPNENYIIYTSKEVDDIRDDINRLQARRVPILLMDEVLSKRNIRWHLMPLIDREGKTVFLVHGRNQRKTDHMINVLKRLGLEIITWEVARRNSKSVRNYIYDIVLSGINLSHVTVVLFTDDERANLRKEFIDENENSDKLVRWQSRPNVFIEAGYALGCRPIRTLFVVWPDKKEKFYFPSDFEGIHFIRYDDSEASRGILRDRLLSSRCELNSRSDWKKIPPRYI